MEKKNLVSNQWTSPLMFVLQSHCEICEYREIQCTQCGQYIQFLHMRRHQDVDCPMRPEPCPHCKNDVPVQQMQVSTKCEDVVYKLHLHKVG